MSSCQISTRPSVRQIMSIATIGRLVRGDHAPCVDLASGGVGVGVGVGVSVGVGVGVRVGVGVGVGVGVKAAFSVIGPLIVIEAGVVVPEYEPVPVPLQLLKL